MRNTKILRFEEDGEGGGGGGMAIECGMKTTDESEQEKNDDISLNFMNMIQCVYHDAFN